MHVLRRSVSTFSLLLCTVFLAPLPSSAQEAGADSASAVGNLGWIGGGSESPRDHHGGEGMSIPIQVGFELGLGSRKYYGTKTDVNGMIVDRHAELGDVSLPGLSVTVNAFDVRRPVSKTMSLTLGLSTMFGLEYIANNGDFQRSNWKGMVGPEVGLSIGPEESTQLRPFVNVGPYWVLPRYGSVTYTGLGLKLGMEVRPGGGSVSFAGSFARASYTPHYDWLWYESRDDDQKDTVFSLAMRYRMGS